MRSFLPRAALSVSVLVGIFAGCAAAPTRREPADKSVVTAKDLENHPDEPIENVLQRKVPGLLVTRTGDGGIALQIRGASSFDGSDTSPLYVLNDLPIELGPGGVLTGVDPYEIESIKVLKGADAGVYGIRGANGVIEIRTKSAATPRR